VNQHGEFVHKATKRVRFKFSSESVVSTRVTCFRHDGNQGRQNTQRNAVAQRPVLFILAFLRPDRSVLSGFSSQMDHHNLQ